MFSVGGAKQVVHECRCRDPLAEVSVQRFDDRRHLRDRIVAALGLGPVAGSAAGGDGGPERSLVAVNDLALGGFAYHRKRILVPVALRKVAGTGLTSLFAHEPYKTHADVESGDTLRPEFAKGR